MVVEPYFCDRCSDQLEPDTQVFQAVQTDDATVFGEDVTSTIEGATAIVHVACWPPAGVGAWREIYRGPLSGIRPGAT
jgi:hypothetical protein